MSLSNSWISQPALTAPLSMAMASKKALRFLQRSSGLFDTGYTDLKADVDRSVVISESDLASEMLSSIGNADDFLDDFPSHMELDSSFNEVFTDLSDFIKEEGLGSIDLDVAPDNILTASQVEVQVKLDEQPPVKKATKRKAPVPPKLADDHSGYASKKARVDCTISDPENVNLSKELKYKERRRKNNLASKLSRETRKQKFGHMECTARKLEQENEDLRSKVTELEMLTKKMKDILVQRLAQR